MMNATQFIEHCQKVVSEYETGTLPLQAAAAKIYADVFEDPFEGPAHPMVYQAAYLAFDIAENYRTEIDDKEDWTELTDTLSKYLAGDWVPTCWILSAMYDDYSQTTSAHSYSVSVQRQNGETLLETASVELKDIIIKTINKLNSKQTDERYLQNLARLMPSVAGKYRLANVEVAEHIS